MNKTLLLIIVIIAAAVGFWLWNSNKTKQGSLGPTPTPQAAEISGDDTTVQIQQDLEQTNVGKVEGFEQIDSDLNSF